MKRLINTAAECALLSILILGHASAAPSESEATRSAASESEQQAAMPPATAEGPSREVQRSLLQKMKSRKPTIRVPATRTLAKYPTAEGARFLAQHGLGSGYVDVRHASYETLVGMNQVGPVADYLLDTAAKEIKRSTPRETTAAMLAIAIASADQTIERRALELFDEAAARAKMGVPFVLSLVDELGAQGDKTSVAVLAKISKRVIFTNCFAVRRAVVQSLRRISLPQSIETLIAILTTATGEVRGDIVRHLTTVSGQQFGLNPGAWVKWWQTQQGKLPRGGGQSISLADALPSTATYYGLPICASRMVFVLDTSASMSGLRILAAKRELSTAIANLPSDAAFNILAFDILVAPWSSELMPATPENKAAAIQWVLLRGLGPQTASYNALEAAFAFDTEAIYFLTDGQPAGGTINDPVQIVAVLTQLNQTRRLTINSIGIAVGPPGPINPFDLFLSSLAALNYGEYRRVDQ
ncbi:MAG TPA: hypothetical protein VHC22_18310 [Pirellulales bacterium]|nr:hypothetical protein [Pirellulales bacterium]